MASFQTRDVRMAIRETMFLGLAALGAWLFLNHELLEGGVPPAANLSEFIVSTAVIYLFLRTIVLVAEMRAPRIHAELVRCPECGQWLDDPTVEGREAHNRIALTPKPTKREIVSAVALRKAVDSARVAGMVRSNERAGVVVPHREAENLSSKDLIAAIDDPDLLERLRHGPHPPDDPRLKR